MKTESALEGAYRHLSSDAVEFDAILKPHIKATARRVGEEDVAYAVSDTTSFVFGGQSRREGLGYVNTKKDQGFRAHITLAIRADGVTPLGVLAVQTLTRTGDAKTRPNEANRWHENIEQANSEVVDPNKLIHVGDRETDIYELLATAQAQGWRYIFRAAQDRCVEDLRGNSKLFDAVVDRKARFKRTVNLSKRLDAGRPRAQKKAFPARGPREATLNVSVASVKIKRPKNRPRTLPDNVPVHVVRVWEPEPPTGEMPVEWVLLTTEPVRTRKQILAVVDGYRLRWNIEVFFNALKTGCSFERRQLETSRSLFNLLAYCLVIAYSLMLHRALIRSNTDRPASAILTRRQIRCLRIMSEGGLPSRPTAKQALEQIAKLGAHLKRNGHPGWRVISRGWQDLLRFEAAYEMLQKAENN